jgi:hypothetical protein
MGNIYSRFISLDAGIYFPHAEGQRVIPFHFKIDTFRQAGEAGEVREAGGAREMICINNLVKWYKS